MPTPSNLRDALLRDEGTRLRPYMDCCGQPWRDCTCRDQGKLTIGTGRNLDDSGISMAENDFMLDNDISRVSAGVLAGIPWFLQIDEVRREVLINVAFNVGGRGLLAFQKMLVAMEAGDWFTAAAHLLDSKAARRLPQRYERLAEQLRTGERQ